MVLVEERYGKMQVNGPVRQKDREDKKQQMAEMQRRKWTGEINPELSSCGLKMNLFHKTKVQCVHQSE